MNTFIRTLAVISVLCAPYVASALTQEELMAQIQTLLAQVATLQQQMGTQTQSTPATYTPSATTVGDVDCPHISRVLKQGSTGDDVTRLQKFLAQDSSIYPEGTVSGYYGALTEYAVQRWQNKFKLVSSGTPASTGYGVVGPRTAALMALQCSNGGGGTATQVGGFIKVTPVSGDAPLIVSVEATINTTHSCGATTYVLNWGDNSPVQNIPLSAGVCQEAKQTFTHTYSYGGTYSLTLGAQGHSTSATVVVSGTPGTVSGGVSTPVNGVGAVADSFSVNTTSGPAPLTVTFSGVLNGSASCGGGYYTLLFGDSQTQTMTYPASCSAQTYSTSHQYSTSGTYNAVLFRGAVGSSIVGNIQIKPGTASSAYQVPTLTQNVGGNARAVTYSFDMPSACTAYDVDWGDGSAHAVAVQGTCSTVSVQTNLTHTYVGTGSYTIMAKRGNSLERSDTASVSIQ